MKYRAVGLSALLACSACAAIPELRFEDDAGADGSLAARDGVSPDAGTSGPAADAAAAPDASPLPPDAADGDAASACPGTTPPGANTCCGTIPCVGSKCAQRCAECAPCAGKVCCVPNSGGQMATCADAPQRCANGGGNGG